METIFVSYRRQDNRWAAGRICDRLNRWFGSERVFRDIDDIEIGKHFPQRIEEAIAQSAVMLVIIGDQWASLSQEESDQPRILQEDDWVRREIELAMQHGVEIIPVLIEGAEMPTPAQLPPTFGDFHLLNAVSISDENYENNMEDLLSWTQLCLTQARTGWWGRVLRFFRRYVTIAPLGFLLGCALTYLIHGLNVSAAIGIRLLWWADEYAESDQLLFLWGYIYEVATLVIISLLMIVVFRMFRHFGLMLGFGLGAIAGDILMLYILLDNLYLEASIVVRVLWVVVLALIVQSEVVQMFINMLLALPKKLTQQQHTFGDRKLSRRV